jgi:hypothetical protein
MMAQAFGGIFQRFWLVCWHERDLMVREFEGFEGFCLFIVSFCYVAEFVVTWSWDVVCVL